MTQSCSPAGAQILLWMAFFPLCWPFPWEVQIYFFIVPTRVTFFPATFLQDKLVRSYRTWHYDQLHQFLQADLIQLFRQDWLLFLHWVSYQCKFPNCKRSSTCYPIKSKILFHSVLDWKVRVYCLKGHLPLKVTSSSSTVSIDPGTLPSRKVLTQRSKHSRIELHGYTVHQQCWTLLLPTDAHNVKKHRVIKTFSN